MLSQREFVKKGQKRNMHRTMPSVSLILHDLRSAHNVGSIFRTADAAGVAKIYLSGYTPSPTDRFGRVQPEIAKTALGAEKTLPWEHSEDIIALMEEQHNDSIQVVAVEQHKRAKNYKSIILGNEIALIFGNETEGVPEEALQRADEIICIPMCGEKESLNVAIAAGIVLFELLH